MSNKDREKIRRIVRRRAENGKVTTFKDLVNHDDFELSERSIRTHLKKLEQENRKDRIVNVGDEGKTGYYVPADMTDEFPKDYEKWKKQSALTDTIDKIEQTREELEKRICRQPTVEEIAEEMGKMPDEDFERLVRETAADDWRSPKNNQGEIERAKNKVQEKVEEALKVHLGWDSKEENESSVYYENNKDIFYEFDFYVEEWLLHEVPLKFRVEVPPKLGKYMEDGEFLVDVPLDDPGDKSTRDYCMSITQQARKQCVPQKDSWDDI